MITPMWMPRASPGYSHTRIVLRHMFPNLMAPYLIMLTAYIAQAILLEAVLFVSGAWRCRACAGLGLMLSGSASDFFQEAPMDHHFSGACNQHRRLCLQSAWRRIA